MLKNQSVWNAYLNVDEIYDTLLVFSPIIALPFYERGLMESQAGINVSFEYL